MQEKHHNNSQLTQQTINHDEQAYREANKHHATEESQLPGQQDALHAAQERTTLSSTRRKMKQRNTMPDNGQHNEEAGHDNAKQGQEQKNTHNA